MENNKLMDFLTEELTYETDETLNNIKKALAKYQGKLQEIIPETSAVRVFKENFGHMNTIFHPDTVNSFACYELLFSYELDEMDMFDNRY